MYCDAHTHTHTQTTWFYINIQFIGLLKSFISLVLLQYFWNKNEKSNPIYKCNIQHTSCYQDYLERERERESVCRECVSFLSLNHKSTRNLMYSFIFKEIKIQKSKKINTSSSVIYYWFSLVIIPYCIASY